MIIGTDVHGDAVELPVELRDEGILDFGSEHALCWHWADDFVLRISTEEHE